MLKQARVEDIANRRMTRIHGLIVVVTRYYPRYLKRNLIDEYAPSLAPSRELLGEFKDCEKAEGDHNLAFEKIDYENKFILDSNGWSELKRLCEISMERDVYLVCHCKLGDRCHREILMLAGESEFGAKIAKVSFPWTIIRGRIAENHLSKRTPMAST